MAENYDLIFGQGASSQYAWSDSDYQNGWKTVGSTPPTAEQFDALQRRSDTKAKDLNNRLSPLETTASKALARVTPAANRLPYFNSSNSATTTAISDFIKTLLDDGNAATARATLGAPSTAGANASGSWNINAATATKLATPRKINITGNATGAATFDGSGDVNINTTVNESKHAINADSATNAGSANKLVGLGYGNTSMQGGANDLSPTVGGDSANMNIASWYGVSFTNGSSVGVIPQGKTAVGIDVRDSVVRAKTFEGTLNGNSATATKLTTPRAISLTGNASGSANFDGSGNVSINTTVNESKHAVKADTATTANTATNATHASSADSATKATNDSNGANIASTYVKKAGDTTTGKITFEAPDLYDLPEVKRTDDAKMSGIRFSTKTKFLGAVGKRLSDGEDLLNLRSDNNTTDVVLDSRNYNNYAPTKTGGGASGTWGINISGNAATATKAGTCTGNSATATKLATARSLWGNNFDGSAAITGAINDVPAIELKPEATTSNNGGFLDFHYNQDTADYTSRIIESASGTLSINNVTITTGKVVTATTFKGALTGNVTGNCSGSSGSCTGNAATATKLATARSIALTGNATGSATFDGSGNISISTNVNTATNADKLDGYHASDLLGKIYPVGSIYMSMSATNPATLFGVGTWKRISQGRMLLGADDSTYKAGATGGEATHTLTAAEMPAHSHGISTSGDHSHYFYGSNDNNGPLTEGDGLDTDGGSHFTRNDRFTTSSAGAHTHTISNSGGGAAHNNMPPYLVCYIWQRTA